MPDTKVEDEVQVGALTGAEFVYCVQAGAPRKFTTAQMATLAGVPPTSDGAALGSGSLQWSDLYLASGGVINWGGGNFLITHLPGGIVCSGSVTVNGILLGNNIISTSQYVNVANTVQSAIYFRQVSGGGGFVFGRSVGGADGHDMFLYDLVAGTTRLALSSSGAFNFSTGIASTSASTGALVVTGGVGIGGHLCLASTSQIAMGVAPSQDPVGARANGILVNAAPGAIYARGAFAWELGRDSNAGAHISFYTDNGSIIVGAGNISSTGSTTAYNTTSDERGKPYRERLSPDRARDVVDALEIYDHDDERNAIRGVGWLAQQGHKVHKSFGSPGETPDKWWQAERAAPMPFVIANLQRNNAILDRIAERLGL